MARRVSDELAAKVQRAIEELPVLEVTREQMVWEVVPFLAPDPRDPTQASLQYMIGIGLPFGIGEQVLHFCPLMDPNDAAEIARVVGRLAEGVQDEVAGQAARTAAPLNGGKSAGGLLLP
jgi:hypothetical protein